uniref:TetR family transcriptional regulator n=1 Tax=Thermosporothrix sp. COM3 TaxID=2490863 RepID=A0A455SLG5_9CHLR|nr:TetR family transcriptional regulator [Thermosporothrix sp. COM3]
MRKKVNHHAEEAASERAAVPVWARPERPRRERPALSREQIVSTALALADAEGINAISIRRIATALGVSAMALYWYIERKEDVLDLMIDAVYGEVLLKPADDWRSSLEAFAIQMREMIHRHPWFASLAGHRPAFGPNTLQKTDYLLGVVSQLGLDMTTNMNILELFNAYIFGFVQNEIGEAEEQRRSGLSEEEWQHSMYPYIQKQVIESGRYPFLAKAILEAQERSPDETFRFGLTRLLEGIASYADAQRAQNHQ